MVDFKTVGVLGVGNMGGALVRGLLQSKTCSHNDVLIYDAHSGAMDSLAKELGVVGVESATDLVEKSDVVVLAVKPQIFHTLASTLRLGAKAQGKTVISVMAGVHSEAIRDHFPASWHVVRVMPNLPLSVGEGATAIEIDGHPEGTLLLVERLFSSCGRTVRVTSGQMDAVTGLSGSGPMYVFEFVEGLVQGGVKAGLTRNTSMTLALQTVKGALKLLETSGEHPSEWTARVCSPGGTTIHGLHVLEQQSFKGTLIAAIEAAVNRSKALS